MRGILAVLLFGIGSAADPTVKREGAQHVQEDSPQGPPPQVSYALQNQAPIAAASVLQQGTVGTLHQRQYDPPFIPVSEKESQFSPEKQVPGPFGYFPFQLPAIVYQPPYNILLPIKGLVVKFLAAIGAAVVAVPIFLGLLGFFAPVIKLLWLGKLKFSKLTHFIKKEGAVDARKLKATVMDLSQMVQGAIEKYARAYDAANAIPRQ